MDTVAWLQAIGTLALVIVTAVYVRHTAKMAEAMRQRPYVHVELRCRFPFMFIEVMDSGERAAYNLQFRVSPSAALTRLTEGDNLAETTPRRMAKGLQCLPPGHRMLYRLKVSHAILDGTQRDDICIAVEYGASREGPREFIEEFLISLDEYDGTPLEAFEDRKANDFLREVKGINLELAEIAGYLCYLASGGRLGRKTGTLWTLRRPRCPLCGEMVAAAASVCPHCQRDLPEGWSADGGDQAEGVEGAVGDGEQAAEQASRAHGDGGTED